MSSPTSFSVTPAIGSPFWSQDYWWTVVEELHAASPDLIPLIVPLIQDRTAVDTGALQASIEGTPNDSDLSDPTLAEFDAADQPQLDAWGHVYAQYQEGDPLGLPTYTNDARQMFFGTAEEDLDVFSSWADGAVNNAADRIWQGLGATSAP